MFWRRESILEVGKCFRGGKVFWRWESVLEAGKCSGGGKVVWRWERTIKCEFLVVFRSK